MLNKLFGKYSIYIFAALMSVVMTLIVLAYNQTINPDGLQYLHTAVAYTNGGLKAAENAFNLPFYSILIAITAKITTLSMLHATYLLNAILDLITVMVFVVIIKELGGDAAAQLIGALIILFFPSFNHLRDQIIRGHGYYAFALMSLLFLMRYLQTNKWSYVFGWTITIIIATLFRIEGSCLALLAPLVTLLIPQRNFSHRIYNTVKIYSIYIITAIVIIPSLLLHKFNSAQTSTHLLSIQRIQQQILSGLQMSWHNLHQKALIIQTNIINPADKHAHSMLALIAGLIADYLGVLIFTLGLLYSILAAYTMLKKTIPTNLTAKVPLFTFIILNIFLTALFITQNFFVSHRYLLLLSLLLLLTVPFALTKIYTNWKTKTPTLTGSRWLFPAIVAWMCYIAISAVGHFGTSKAYIVNAGKWLNHNLAPHNILCENNPQLAYFANQSKSLHFSINKVMITQNQLKSCDYLAMQISKNEPWLNNKLDVKLKIKPIKEFHNRRGDKVLIYKIKARRRVVPLQASIL